jgi:probable HAF family extracellular repeat protein
MRSRLVLGVAAVLCVGVAGLSTSSHAQNFEGLGFAAGYNSSRADGVSADGSVVVGLSGPQVVGSDQASRWTAATGMVGLGFVPPATGTSWALAVSGDGSTVVGNSGSPDQAFRWTASGGMVGLGFLPTGGSSVANAVNADGSVVVGGGATTVNGMGTQLAYRWTSSTGMVALGTLPGMQNSIANGVSANGNVVVGNSDCTNCVSNPQAFRWTASSGMVGLGFLSGQTSSNASAISANGNVIIGNSGGDAVSWIGGTINDLGAFTANAVNADGSVIVGTGIGADIWTQANGLMSVQDLLIVDGVNLTGWELQATTGVSADGRVLVGFGIDPQGLREAWIAQLPIAGGVPEPSTWAMMLIGFAGIGFAAYRRKSIPLFALTALLLGSALAMPAPAAADIYTYTISNGTFTTGTISGTVTVDGTAQGITAVDINAGTFGTFTNIFDRDVTNVPSVPYTQFSIEIVNTTDTDVLILRLDDLASLFSGQPVSIDSLSGLFPESMNQFITHDSGIPHPAFGQPFSGTLTVAVPELSTWAMLLFGFAGLGFLAYRRRLIEDHQI